MANQGGTPAIWNSPQPFASTVSARPTAADGKDEAEDQRVEHDDTEIAGPAPGAAESLDAAGRQQLPERHDGEDGGESAEADIGFMGKQEIGHGHDTLRSMRLTKRLRPANIQ